MAFVLIAPLFSGTHSRAHTGGTKYSLVVQDKYRPSSCQKKCCSSGLQGAQLVLQEEEKEEIVNQIQNEIKNLTRLTLKCLANQ